VPEVLTVLRIDIARDYADAERDAARMRALVDEAGATVVATTPAGPSGLAAAFPWASDAATAALRLAGGLPAGAQARIGLSTGEVVLGPGAVEGPARDRADALAALPDGAPVLLANSTAMMVHHTLPPGVELVDRGVVTDGAPRGERVYELRLARADAAGDDAAASNLGWARRAAARLVVGRDDHVARLEEAWALTLAGDHRMVVVSGDPGIGKTTVAAELALRVHSRGGIVLYGRWDEEGLAPYQAVREALGTYSAACPRPLLRADLATYADELARLLPDLGARLGGLRPPLVDDPDAERLRLFDAVRDWLDAIAARHPVLAVLDDMQWADRSSLLLLRHLLDAPPDQPLLVVVTLRDGDVEGMGSLHTLGSFDAGGVDRIELAGLRPEDVTELVAQTLGRPVSDDEAEVCAALTEETAGNPLFVHEILAGLDPDDAAGDLVAAADRLPERMHDVVHWRLSRLDPAVADVLATASVIGEEFALDVLAAAAGLRPLELRRRLDDASRAGVLRDVGGRRAGFTHAVVRSALQDDVGPERAAGLHRRIAEALTDPDRGEPAAAAEVAHHWLHAADAETAATAVRWGRAAADQARRETAFEGAVWFLVRTIQVHDRFRPGGDRDADELACELRLELAEAHDRAGEFVARDRRHLEAAELARHLDRTDLFGRAALGYGGRLPAAPPPNPTARHLLVEALDRLPDADSRARALTLARLSHVLHFSAPYDERRTLAGDAEAMARRLDAPVVLASVLCSRVLALDGPDDVEDHLDVGAEVMRIGERTGDGDLILQGARARIQSLFTMGAHDAARDLADTFIRLADTVRHPDHLRLASMWQTMWTALEGRFDDALGQADRLRQRLEVAGHSQVLTIWFAQTYVVRWMRGELAGSLPMIEAGLHQDPQAPNWWALKAWALSGTGDTAGAADLLAGRPAADLAGLDHNFTWLMTAVGAGSAAAAVGDTEWAAASHAALAPYSGNNCVMGWAAYLGAVDHHLGMLEAVLGRADEAVDHLSAAVARHQVIAARPWEAVTGAWLANLLAERDNPGDAERAATLNQESRTTAKDLGLVVLPPANEKLAN
jgi:hypothetical protein